MAGPLGLNGVAKVVTREDGDQIVPKFAVYEFMRADVDAKQGEGDDGDVIIEEWVDPGKCSSPTLYTVCVCATDGMKEVFFRNVTGIHLDAAKFGIYFLPQVMMTLKYCDNYNVIVSGPLMRPFTHAVYNTMSGIAWLLGVKPVHWKYMPQRLHTVAFGKAKGPK